MLKSSDPFSLPNLEHVLSNRAFAIIFMNFNMFHVYRKVLFAHLFEAFQFFIASKDIFTPTSAIQRKISAVDELQWSMMGIIFCDQSDTIFPVWTTSRSMCPPWKDWLRSYSINIVSPYSIEQDLVKYILPIEKVHWCVRLIFHDTIYYNPCAVMEIISVAPKITLIHLQ